MNEHQQDVGYLLEHILCQAHWWGEQTPIKRTCLNKEYVRHLNKVNEDRQDLPARTKRIPETKVSTLRVAWHWPMKHMMPAISRISKLTSGNIVALRMFTVTEWLNLSPWYSDDYFIRFSFLNERFEKVIFHNEQIAGSASSLYSSKLSDQHQRKQTNKNTKTKREDAYGYITMSFHYEYKWSPYSRITVRRKQLLSAKATKRLL